MRMIVNIGYEDYLVPANADIAAFLQTLAGMRPVEKKQDRYDDVSEYVAKKLKGHHEISPRFVEDSQIIDEARAAEIDQNRLQRENAKLADNNAKLKSDMAILQKQVEDIQKALGANEAKKEEKSNA